MNPKTSGLIENPSTPFDWKDLSNWLLYNPRWPEERKQVLFRARSLIDQANENLWIATSGSQSGIGNWIGFDRKDFLSAAESLSRHYQFQKGEIWIKVLPSFHVGGLSIFARAEVSGQEVVELAEWNPALYADACKQAQWSSLVPTQIYDLIRERLKGPSSLRGVFVGGAPLDSELYLQARRMGWPLLPTFGMTETSSQIASASIDSLKRRAWPQLELLPHWEATIYNRQLRLRGKGLATSRLSFDGDQWQIVPLIDGDGWFLTEDVVELRGRHVIPLGRLQGWVKTRGELVSRAEIEYRFGRVMKELDLGEVDHAIDFKEDSRLGYALCLYLTPHLWPLRGQILSTWAQNCAPFERIERVYLIDELPRSDLGKIIYALLPGELRK